MGDELGSLLLIMRQLISVVALIASFLSISVRAESTHPVVASMGGTGPAWTLLLGAEKELRIGQEIPWGTIVKTGPKNTVTLTFPDGSIVGVDADTQFEVTEQRSGVPVNTLKSGQVRGSILKLKEAAADGKKHKFLIRTKAAVMGVRGTEFVMATDPAGYATQVHTLEGVVDVGQTEGALSAGQSVAVESGKFVEATEAGLSPVNSFNRDEFLKNLTPDSPGKVPGVAFTNPMGGTAMVTALPPVGFLKSEENKKADERKLPPEEQKDQPKNAADDRNDQPKPPEEESRKMQLARFQIAAFGLFERVWEPSMPATGANGSYRDLLRMKAINVSWNPEFPIPYTSVFSAKGHVGFIFGQNGSLNSNLWMKELSLFGVVTFFKKFFGELGWGSILDTGYNTMGRIGTLGGGMVLGSGKGLDRLFVNFSENIGEVERFWMLKAGIGFRF